MAVKEILVPDLGGAENVEVIELNVKPGDKVDLDQGLVTLESDKATMEVPSPFSGIIKTLSVKLGDKLSEGQCVALIETEVAEQAVEKAISEISTSSVSDNASCLMDVVVPDLGGADFVDLIEIHIKPGDQVNFDQGLMTLESDKATMDVPSPFSGIVHEVFVKVGEKLSQGQRVANILSQEKKTSESKLNLSPSVNEISSKKEDFSQSKALSSSSSPQLDVQKLTKEAEISAIDSRFHATPIIRRMAAEFGVDLSRVKPTGLKGRILKEDIQLYVKQQLVIAQEGGKSSFALPEMPVIDFNKFGETEIQPLSKIKKLTGLNLSRNWILVPHVTQFDEADITELEAYRKGKKEEAESKGVKLTPLAFIMKAVSLALKAFPRFNASLSPDNQSLILKKYINIGVAVDTPEGLVVPVIREVDQKDLYALAKELAEVSEKARQGKLLPKDMQGGCFTISSLGGIGGTAFTPIVNAPEVAILGVSKAQLKPVYENNQFLARLMLPLSLSYDHRVIDGAEGARFITCLSKNLAEVSSLTS